MPREFNIYILYNTFWKHIPVEVALVVGSRLVDCGLLLQFAL